MGQLIVLYTLVPCPACAATAMQPCQEEGQTIEIDVHLERAMLFMSARSEQPPMTLKRMLGLANGDSQPDEG